MQTTGAGAATASDSAFRAETRAQLTASAHKCFGAIPAHVVVDHLVYSNHEADFAVIDAALDALQRRWGFALRDALAVVSAPSNGSV